MSDLDKLQRRLEQSKQKVKILEDLLEEKTREAFLWTDEARRALHDIEEVIKAIPDPLVLTDTDFKILKINDVFSQRLGYTHEELIGQSLRKLVISTSRNWNAFCVDEASQSTESEILLGKENQNLPVMISVSRYSPAAHDDRYVFIMKDISLRLKLEQERERVNRELEQKVSERTQDLMEARKRAEAANEAKTIFLANMSHEIRTPLNAITGIISLLVIEKLPPELHDLVSKLQVSSDSLLGIVNKILDFTKLDTGELEVESIEFNLPKLLENVHLLFEEIARNKGIEIRLDTPHELEQFWIGDQNRIRQVLNNLVSNAIKFTPQGYVRLSMTVENSGANTPTVHFEVSDTGVGIKEDKIASIFKPFVQEDSSTTRVFGGTGLGLAICKHIADLLGGTMECQSVKGQGTRFRFSIPLKKSLSQVSRSTDAHDLSDLPRKRILVIEDNDVNQMVMQMFLKKLNQDCVIAADGLQGVEASNASSFDLIFMDCQMPVMDGFEATRSIRHAPSSLNQKTPIIAMTANAMKSVKDLAFSVGMDDYVTKPLTLGRVEATLRKWNLGQTLWPERPSSHETTPAISWDIIDDIVMLANPGEDVLAELLQKFKAARQEFQQNIQLAVQDGQQLARISHKFKTSCGIMGALKAVEYCGKLEALGRAGDLETFGETVKILEKTLDKATAILENYQMTGVRAA